MRGDLRIVGIEHLEGFRPGFEEGRAAGGVDHPEVAYRPPACLVRLLEQLAKILDGRARLESQFHDGTIAGAPPLPLDGQVAAQRVLDAKTSGVDAHPHFITIARIDDCEHPEPFALVDYHLVARETCRVSAFPEQRPPVGRGLARDDGRGARR